MSDNDNCVDNSNHTLWLRIRRLEERVDRLDPPGVPLGPDGRAAESAPVVGPSSAEAGGADVRTARIAVLAEVRNEVSSLRAIIAGSTDPDVGNCVFDYLLNYLANERAARHRVDAGVEALEARLDVAEIRADRAEARVASLEAALRAWVECTEHGVRVPSGHDPLVQDVVAQARGSFGALMSEASLQWREMLERSGGPVGGEHVACLCRATLESLLRNTREALAGSAPAPADADGERPTSG